MTQYARQQQDPIQLQGPTASLLKEPPLFQQWIMTQYARQQQSPIQLQGPTASLLKEPPLFRQKLFLKTFMTPTSIVGSPLVAFLAVPTQWTRCRRGARTAWSPTSTPPPRPTSRC